MKVKFNGKDINIRRIGILTGGGDCAGHNAVIVGLLRRINQANLTLPADEKMELVGLLEGWKSLTRDSDNTMPLTLFDIEESFTVAGTILKSSRTNLFSKARRVTRKINWQIFYINCPVNKSPNHRMFRSRNQIQILSPIL